jgi:hypothetical protein
MIRTFALILAAIFASAGPAAACGAIFGQLSREGVVSVIGQIVSLQGELTIEMAEPVGPGYAAVTTYLGTYRMAVRVESVVYGSETVGNILDFTAVTSEDDSGARCMNSLVETVNLGDHVRVALAAGDDGFEAIALSTASGPFDPVPTP